METGVLEVQEITKGDTYQQALEFYEDSAETTPHDLTVYTEIAVQVRDTQDVTGTLIAAGSKSAANGTVTISGTGNNVLLIDLGAITAAEGRYYYDIRFVQTEDVVDTLLKGVLIVTDNITQL